MFVVSHHVDVEAPEQVSDRCYSGYGSLEQRVLQPTRHFVETRCLFYLWFGSVQNTLGYFSNADGV